jgi:hypothetical protein
VVVGESGRTRRLCRGEFGWLGWILKSTLNNRLLFDAINIRGPPYIVVAR